MFSAFVGFVSNDVNTGVAASRRRASRPSKENRLRGELRFVALFFDLRRVMNCLSPRELLENVIQAD